MHNTILLATPMEGDATVNRMNWTNSHLQMVPSVPLILQPVAMLSSRNVGCSGEGGLIYDVIYNLTFSDIRRRDCCVKPHCVAAVVSDLGLFPKLSKSEAKPSNREDTSDLWGCKKQTSKCLMNASVAVSVRLSWSLVCILCCSLALGYSLLEQTHSFVRAKPLCSSCSFFFRCEQPSMALLRFITDLKLNLPCWNGMFSVLSKVLVPTLI